MKYKFLDYNIYFDEEQFYAVLNKYAQKGYILKKAGFYFLAFEKCTREIHYQIYYGNLTNEVKQIALDKGYRFIDHFKNINFFETDSPNVPLLYTDETAKRSAQLNIFKIRDFFLLLIGAAFFFFITQSDVNIDNLLNNKGELYANYPIYLGMVLHIIVPISILIQAFHMLLMRCIISKNLNNNATIVYKKISRIVVIITFWILTSIVLVLLILMNSIKLVMTILILLLAIFIYQYAFLKWSYTFENDNKRQVIQAVIILAFLITSISINHCISNTKMPFDLKTYHQYNTQDTVYVYTSNIFVKHHHISNDNQQEDIYISKNEEIAKEVLVNVLQHKDRMNRLQKGEFDIQVQNYQIIGIESEPLRPYEEIIQQFKKVDIENIDECYCINNEYFIRKDYKIISTIISGKPNLNRIIEVLK